MAKIDAFFRLLNQVGGSDLHLSSGNPPIMRVKGELKRLEYPELKHEQLQAMLYEICPEEKQKIFEEKWDLDFAYELPGIARYRANYLNQKWGVAAVFREIPSQILTAAQLGLPPITLKLAMLRGNTLASSCS